MVGQFYDHMETRDPAHRRQEQLSLLRQQIAHAKAKSPHYQQLLAGIDPDALLSLDDLAALPVTRKSDLVAAQQQQPPFAGLSATDTASLQRLFLSPGPIADPEGFGRDWWRIARALHAAGFVAGDIIHNSFSYHLTPAGHMFESGAHALGCPVIPAGVGQSEQQILALRHFQAVGYVGTPDFLKSLLLKADELGTPITSVKKALVSGGALLPALRQFYQDRGISMLQCYGTADLGLIAYESPAQQGLIADEQVIIEIVTPGTGDPVGPGEVGEVLVTMLTNRDYPLIRYATGDLSAWLDGASPCGRTAPRIKGWMGRADQTTKVRGMFIRPEQVAALRQRHPEIAQARLVITHDSAQQDQLCLQMAFAAGALPDAAGEAKLLEAAVGLFKVRPSLACGQQALPRDGKVIDDQRPVQAG